jgi:NADH-quinone oxidoreductase subunit J
MEMLIFSIFAVLALGSAVVVVAHRSPVYSTMSLVLTLLSIAVLFVMLGAPFIGVLQVLIYTGAIVVLFLFVIMLLNVGREEPRIGNQRAQLVFSILGALTFGGLVVLTLLSVREAALQPLVETDTLFQLKPLARVMFGEYLLAFEIVGLLLLVAVVGATVVARRPQPGENIGLLHQGEAVASGFEPRVNAELSTPHAPEEETVP